MSGKIHPIIQDFKVAEAEDKNFSVFALKGHVNLARGIAPGKDEPPPSCPPLLAPARELEGRGREQTAGPDRRRPKVLTGEVSVSERQEGKGHFISDSRFLITDF